MRPAYGVMEDNDDSRSNGLVRAEAPPPEPEIDPITGLNLSGAGITNLPPSIGFFTTITTLNLSNNQLTKLPAEIGKLVNLQKLDLSNNSLVVLPREIGRLHRLRELDLHGNNITTLPTEMGRLVRLEKLRFDASRITSPPYDVLSKDVRSIIFYLRDRIDATRAPPPRRWISKPSTLATHTTEQSVKVMCYNVLSPSYATQALYPHCPSWALDWSYRSNLILRELLAFNADIICLQEVETEHFEMFFQPELGKVGYDGIHRPKSRYNTMSDEDRRFVDGCCIFWKNSRFDLHSQHLVDFVAQTIARGDTFLKDHDAFNRLISKDNIGLIALLEVKSSKPGVPHNGHFPSLHDTRSIPQRKGSEPVERFNPNSKFLMICNTHIHWNPEFSDVKLMQTQLLIEEVQKLMPRSVKVPVIICGDFNSTPDSGVWEFLQSGHLSPTHQDFGKLQWGHYTKDEDGKEGGGCKHDLALHSAYSTVMGKEPEFTNASFDFRGCLSYLWYSHDRIRVHGVLETISAEMLEEDIGMPNAQFPSDHVSLFAEFVMDDALTATGSGANASGTGGPKSGGGGASGANSSAGNGGAVQHHPQQRAPAQRPRNAL